MKWLWLATGLLAAAADGAELLPQAEGRQLGVLVRGIELPGSLRKDLTSGLTNRVLLRVTLATGTRTLVQRAVDVAIKYDLWDERFAFTVTVDGMRRTAVAIATVDEVLARLADSKLTGLFAPGEVPAGDLVLRAEVLFNPIDNARLEQIRKWVAENNVLAGAGSGSFGASTSNAVFNRIFEQYTNGPEAVSAGRNNLTSKPFRMADLQ
jgi:triacylglycerol esterase/lipase EstA (alpha/beta hydrolase family)